MQHMGKFLFHQPFRCFQGIAVPCRQFFPQLNQLLTFAMQTAYHQDQILITKPTKKGERQVDLKPLIYQMYRTGDAVFMQVSTGSSNNIKPELVMEAFYHSLGEEYPPFAMQIQREEVYADLGDENERKLMPLEALGEDIE